MRIGTGICIGMVMIAVTWVAGTASEESFDQEAAVHIDGLIHAWVQETGAEYPSRLDASAWYRRLSLALAGRNPSITELQRFSQLDEQGRRQRAIDTWLESEAYVSQQFHFWADLLRVQSRLQGRFSGAPYIDYLKTAISEHTPYDVMVRDLITANGPAMQAGNGATGYYLRDSGMLPDHLANGVRAFLGTHLSCAQCHDHPTDVWTQTDFHSLLAFLDGSGVQRDREQFRRLAPVLRRANLDQDQRRLLRRLGLIIGVEVASGGDGSIAAPDDGNGRLQARTPFGPTVTASDGPEPRVAFADWVVHPDNARFTQTIVNRLWARLFGRGLVEPLDDFHAGSEAAAPELFAYLCEVMHAIDYDLRRFQRICCLTEAFARCGSPPDQLGAGLVSPMLQRLRAEQIWDSLMILAVPDLEGRRDSSAEVIHTQYATLSTMQPEALLALVENAITAREQAQELRREGQRIRRAMRTANDRESRRALQAQAEALQDRRAALRAQLEPIMALQGRRAGRQGDPDPRWRGLPEDWRRASELASPADPGHPLRQFGQSDREQIDHANRSPSVTQALTLLNGIPDAIISHERSAIRQHLAAEPAGWRRIELVYLACLGRQPSTAERERAFAWGADQDAQALADLLWACILSNEWLFPGATTTLDTGA